MMSCGEDQRSRLCFLLYVTVVECIFPTIHSASLAPYISSYEIIIPRRLEPGVGKAKKEDPSYIIEVAGKEHIIRLRQKNNFLVENLPVFTYDSEGRKVKRYPNIPAECYYGGYVEGMANSLVALSTCFGLRGFLQIRGLDYGIEPLEDSRTFQHLLYLTNTTAFNSTACGLRTEELGHQAAEVERGKYFRFVSKPMYIELFVVVDNKMFRYEANNETRVIYIVLDTVNMVYSHYRSLNIDIILVGLDIWKKENHIKLSSNGTELSDNFKGWKTAQTEKIRRDTTHLFVHQRFDKEPWQSYLGGICKPNLSIGIDPYLNRNLVEFSKLVSHMLGHNIGLPHDEPNCFCDREPSCIMNHVQAKFAMFSNCSVSHLSRLQASRSLKCLYNVPSLTSIFRFKGCGNKVVDAGEQCDCGTVHQCYQDPCCHHNCTFKGRAVCSREGCCQKCQMARRGTLCRPSTGLCDLPEYCSGKSIWCPEDTYKQDGTLCAKDTYCYEKNCVNHHLQCADIFGEEAQAASLNCFMMLNMAGDEIGNCGGNGGGGTFVKCKEKDILCGRLHCSNIGKQLNSLTYTQSLVRGESCWTIKQQHGHGTTDRGAVMDGTSCNKKKICINQTCVPMSVLKPGCNPDQMCHNKGVCNNRNHCHCHSGWAPPDCLYFGAGGSIDSGSPVHAFTAHLFSYAFKVVIPLILLGMAFITFLWPKLKSLITQHGQRISCWG